MNIIFIQIFFFLLLFPIELNESINANKENKIKKEQKSELINLTDRNFNSFVINGKYNRWLILFYIESCYHCERALHILSKILNNNHFRSINNIKFGKIDVSINAQINFRFNISQVPEIIMIENNSMIELDLYPNEINLLNFIESNFSNSLNIFPLPKNDLLKYYYLSFNNSLSFFVYKINDILQSYNINYTINPIIFIMLYIIFCILFWTIIFKGYMKCCSPKKKENINTNTIKNEKKDENTEKSENIENKNNNDNKEEKKNNSIDKEENQNNSIDKKQNENNSIGKEEKKNNSIKKKYFRKNKKHKKH